MQESYKCNDILGKNTFDVRKMQPSKVESYLGSENMNRLATTRSDIRIPPRGLAKGLSILNILILHWTHYSQLLFSNFNWTT